MSRTQTILQQEGLVFKSTWVDCPVSDLEHALERFLLSIDDPTFDALLESLVRQREALGEQR